MSKTGYYATCPDCGREIFSPDLTEVRHDCGGSTQLIQMEWPCRAVSIGGKVCE
jgi:hypothetical protein